MTPTTTTQIDPGVANFYDKNLLTKAMPVLLHTRFAQVRDIPSKSSKVIKFRRYNLLLPATTPLVEGVTPIGSQMSKTDITATVQPYGDYVTLTDEVQYTIEDNALLEASEELGQQAGNTIDRLTREVLHAGTNVQYASSATDRGTVTASMKLTRLEVKEAIRTLKRNKAMKITSMVDASTGVGTLPINSCFVGIVHPDTTYDLKEETGFIPVEKYGQRVAMPDEIGAIDEARFIESTEAKVFTGEGSGGVDVYSTLIMGREAYGITRISGQTLRNIIKPLGSAGSADPLDQRATSGWKMTFVAKILNQDWIVRIEHGATA